MKKQFRIKKGEGFYELETKVPIEQIENVIAKKIGGCFYIKLCAICDTSLIDEKYSKNKVCSMCSQTKTSKNKKNHHYFLSKEPSILVSLNNELLLEEAIEEGYIKKIESKKKTLTQLKKDLKKGVKVKTVLHTNERIKVGEIRKITKTQTNGIYLNGSYLPLPKASLLEYVGNTFKIYHKGTRPLNQKEKRVLQMIEGQNYFNSKIICKKYGAEYLLSGKNGRSYSSYNNVIRTPKVKGPLFAIYEIIK